ncbi:MAG: hypothetical protein ACQEXO_16560 [Pseudomonadota bacterium]
MTAAAIYFRSDEIIVVPQGGGGGHFIDVEPIEVVPLDADAVQAAVERALQVSAVTPDDAPPKGWKTPLLKRVGVKSYREFMRGAVLCFVFEDAGIFDVEHWQPARDGRGYEPAPGGATQLRGTDGLGVAVLNALGIR